MKASNLARQKRMLDRELRRAGKIRSNFRNKKQRASLIKLAALQKHKIRKEEL
jgi:hypothetical protein